MLTMFGKLLLKGDPSEIASLCYNIFHISGERTFLMFALAYPMKSSIIKEKKNRYVTDFPDRFYIKKLKQEIHPDPDNHKTAKILQSTELTPKL